MKILITGAGGLLGEALAARPPEQWEAVALTREELDISSAGTVREALERHRPGLVINAAAFTDVDGAETRPDAARAANTNGPRNLAEETRRQDSILLSLSTDYVFDGAKGEPYDENDTPAPLSVYGKTKLAGEEEIRRLNPRHFIVRTSWLYDNRGASFAKNALELARNNEEVRIAEDQRGSPTYVPHLTAALALLAGSENFGTHHIAGSGGASRLDFVREIYTRLGISTPLAAARTSDFPRPARRPANSELATARRNAIELPPWREGVAEFVRREAAGKDGEGG